jgi:hypothetical protein
LYYHTKDDTKIYNLIRPDHKYTLSTFVIPDEEGATTTAQRAGTNVAAIFNKKPTTMYRMIEKIVDQKKEKRAKYWVSSTTRTSMKKLRQKLPNAPTIVISCDTIKTMDIKDSLNTEVKITT